MHNAVPLLSDATRAQLAGVVLFGDTKNAQSKATITGYPKDKTVTYCTKDDGVCWGQLRVTPGHMAYLTNGDEDRAVKWLSDHIDAAMSSGASAPAAMPAAMPAMAGM